MNCLFSLGQPTEPDKLIVAGFSRTITAAILAGAKTQTPEIHKKFARK